MCLLGPRREEDVEMLARFLPDLRNLDISGIEMSRGLLGAILSHFHHLKALYGTQGLQPAKQQTAHLSVIHRDCCIVALPPVRAVITHVAMSVT